MRRLSRIVLTVSIAGILLFVADRILQPIPIPTGTAVLGGLLVLFVSERMRAWLVVAGLLVGGGAGTIVHLMVHLTGQSTRPVEGLPAHVAGDGTRGLAVAGIVMIVVMVAWMIASRGRDRRRSATLERQSKTGGSSS